ncbi:MAG: primosomal protein N', partial [Bacilli bacterium]|nr:primosomal protein N' [Bacilli bacterium]
GYSNSIFCRSCGKVIRCPDCGIPLTYHKNNNILKCHHCDYTMYKPPVCPSCKSKYLSTNGFGTEKIVDELYKLFPNIKVLRLDSDVGQIKNNIAKTLKSFANLEADVLVGTQMIAKGHDFPNVTLVGVVSADIGLSLPTYRSSERVFQLITQAVGRAGRKDKLGSAIIQTFNPNHYAITCSSKQDYEQFFLQEMQIRKQTQYPPYVNLISLDVSALTERYVEEIASSIKERILKQNIENVTILGPVQPYIAKENGKYHRIIILKTKNNDIIKAFIKDLLNSLKGLSQVNIKVDIDPYSI